MCKLDNKCRAILHGHMDYEKISEPNCLCLFILVHHALGAWQQITIHTENVSFKNRKILVGLQLILVCHEKYGCKRKVLFRMLLAHSVVSLMCCDRVIKSSFYKTVFRVLFKLSISWLKLISYIVYSACVSSSLHDSLLLYCSVHISESSLGAAPFIFVPIGTFEWLWHFKCFMMELSNNYIYLTFFGKLFNKVYEGQTISMI